MVQRPESGYSLDTSGGERFAFAGAELLLKASGNATGGAFAIV